MNPYVANVIAVDCLLEERNKAPTLNFDACNKLFPTIMDHYVATLPCIAITSLHSADTDGEKIGSDLDEAFGLCCMKVPVLVLDIRKRDLGQYQEADGKMLTGERLFARMKEVEEELFESIKAIGSADVYEQCRIAHFHSMLLQDPDVSSTGTYVQTKSRRHTQLFEAIRKRRESNRDKESEDESKKPLARQIAEFLTRMEYRAYWTLLPKKRREKLQRKGQVKDVEQGWKEYYKDAMNEARLSYYNLLTSPYLYSGHASNLRALENLVQDLSKKDKLPKENNVEGLLMLQKAWDIIDIGTHVATRFKWIAKVLYLVLLLLAAAITIITVLAESVDRSVRMPQSFSFKPAQLFIFSLSVASSFVAGMMAFLNPVRRWQQVRHVSSSMESTIWMFRTRTGPFVTGDANDHDSPEIQLKEHVLDAWEQLMVSADVQETSFNRVYSHSVYKHGQHEPASTRFWGNRVAPENGPSTDKGEAGLQGNSITARESRQAKLEGKKDDCTENDIEQGTPDVHDDHFCPIQPEAYIVLRVQGMISFYKNRIPAYTRLRNWLSVIIMVGTSSGAILSFLDFSQYVAIITTITSGIVSYLEFHSTGKKLSRYNATVVALESVLIWWYSITSVDKASTANVEQLVSRAEAILNSERGTWLSTAAKSKDERSKIRVDNAAAADFKKGQ